MLSSSPGDVAPQARRDLSAALARLLGLLESARPADIRAIVSALPEAELAEAIEAVQGRIPLPLREYILADGTSALLIALARQGVLRNGEAPKNAVDRVLLRFDPQADAAFFDLDRGNSQVRWNRGMILRKRKGPDGRAVIPPKVKQALLDAVAAGQPDGRLIYEIAAADDPDLVRALMPYAGMLGPAAAASVITTLRSYGLRAEAKRLRNLCVGRNRRFPVLGFRRLAELSRRFHSDTSSFPAPGLNPLTLEEYRRYFVFSASHSARAVAWTALRAGTVSAADVLEHTRPAALTVWLAVATPDHGLRPGERRAADDVRVLLRQHAGERLGDDPRRWILAMTRVGSYQGTILDFLADPDLGPGHGYAPNQSRDPDTGVHVANVLLALAPVSVAARVVAEEVMQRHALTDMITSVPLCRALVEHVITRGDAAQWEGLARNEAAPDSVLARLLEKLEKKNKKDKEDKNHKFEPAFAIMDRVLVGPEILERAWAAVPHDYKFSRWIVECAKHDTARAMHALRCTAHETEFFLKVLRMVVEQSGPSAEIAAYALLAEVAGVEAVWALDLDRAGSLDALNPHVRESMATGDAQPLLAAARAAVPFGHGPLVFERARTDEELDQPLNRPLENLIRARLDGHLDRWLQLAALIQAKPELSDEELISELPSGSR